MRGGGRRDRMDAWLSWVMVLICFVCVCLLGNCPGEVEAAGGEGRGGCEGEGWSALGEACSP